MSQDCLRGRRARREKQAGESSKLVGAAEVQCGTGEQGQEKLQGPGNARQLMGVPSHQLIGPQSPLPPAITVREPSGKQTEPRLMTLSSCTKVRGQTGRCLRTWEPRGLPARLNLHTTASAPGYFPLLLCDALCQAHAVPGPGKRMFVLLQCCLSLSLDLFLIDPFPPFSTFPTYTS